MKLMLLAVQIVERRQVTTITGRRSGMVMEKKRWKTFAPSIFAASYISWGIACIPARNIIVQKGVPCQTVATITDQSAIFGLARNWTSVVMWKVWISSMLIKPFGEPS